MPKAHGIVIFHNKYGIINLRTGELFSNKATFHLLELPELNDVTGGKKGYDTKLYRLDAGYDYILSCQRPSEEE